MEYGDDAADEQRQPTRDRGCDADDSDPQFVVMDVLTDPSTFDGLIAVKHRPLSSFGSSVAFVAFFLGLYHMVTV